jgi:hypothetical protein
LAYKDIFSISLNEESRISFVYLKIIFEKKFLKAFIPCSRSLLKPVEHLMELVHMVGEIGSSKPGGCSTYTSSWRGPFKNALLTSI